MVTFQYVVGAATILSAIFVTLTFFRKRIKESASSEKEKTNVKFGLRHYYPASLFPLDDHYIEICIANNNLGPNSIRHVDWCLWDEHSKTRYLSSVRNLNLELPGLIPSQGLLIKNSLNEINLPLHNLTRLDNLSKCHFLKRLYIQVEMMNRELYYEEVPLSLKLALLRLHVRSRFGCFYRWYVSR